MADNNSNFGKTLKFHHIELIFSVKFSTRIQHILDDVIHMNISYD